MEPGYCIGVFTEPRQLRGNMKKLRAPLILLFLFSSAVVPARAALTSTRRPDIIFILSDDQRWDTMRYMPRTKDLLPVNYVNAFVSNPLCCPSRSTILTGLYSHDDGVWTNKSGNFGGWAAFQAWEQNGGISIASALHSGGYRTGLFGKFLNGWDGTMANGWDEFAGMTQVSGSTGPHDPFPYYNYTLSGVHDGRSFSKFYGTDPSDYTTTVLSSKVKHYIAATSPDAPMFLYYAPNAPHSAKGSEPPIPAPRDTYASIKLPPQSPNVNEADVSDKPRYIQAQEQIDQHFLDHWRRQAAKSLLAVDRSVASILRVQDARDPGLRNTVVIFMSDNGYATGAHRWMGKSVPYEESIRVPMRAYFPGQPAQAVTKLVNNLDIAPTIADAARVTFQTNGDGESLLSSDARSHFVIESAGTGHSFCGVRTNDSMYVKYRTGEVEYYDLNRDPYELQNLPNAPKVPTLYALASRQCSPLPPDWPRPTL